MAGKKNGLVCSMCGAHDSSANPVVTLFEGLNLCTDCIKFIDDSRDAQLKKGARAYSKGTEGENSIPKPGGG